MILPGLQEKFLPYSPRAHEDVQALLESERRLLYVALTRTRQRLHLITRPSDGPPHLQGDQGPSRFISELCFPVAQEFGSWLDHRTSEDNTLTLSCPVTPVAERYSAREQVLLHGQMQTEASDVAPLWTQSRLNHAVLGNGSVVKETDDSFEVTFDSGDTLNFSKKSAHLYFSPLTPNH